MKKPLTLTTLLLLAALCAPAQQYHEDDKEGLRAFLRQPSTEEGMINAQFMGLSIADTLNWDNSEEWINIITGFGFIKWDDEVPKRMYYILVPAFSSGVLDAGKWSELKELWCGGSKIIDLNVKNNIKLLTLNCSSTQFTNFDISNNIALNILYCTNNQFTSLDISKNVVLKHLDCSRNQLTQLDITNNTVLESLDISLNQFTEFSVNNSELMYLYCYYNLLNTLNVSNNDKLKKIHCEVNQLTALDLSSNPALEVLCCSFNQLTDIDMSNNPALIELACEENQIATLNVSKNEKLEHLRCNNNRLSLSELFAASKQISEKDHKCLGTQYLEPQEVSIGTPLFADQSVFDNIYTNYSVIQNGLPAPAGSYSITKGVLTINKKGIYTVTMTNNAILSNPWAECPAEVIVDLSASEVGISDAKPETFSFSVYPNPTTGQLTIDNGQLIINNVEIYDILGRKQEIIVNYQLSTVNCSHLPAGIYFLRVNDKTVKIVKE